MFDRSLVVSFVRGIGLQGDQGTRVISFNRHGPPSPLRRGEIADDRQRGLAICHSLTEVRSTMRGSTRGRVTRYV